MATITKTKAGSFKAVVRRINKVLKTKTFRLKKHAREWARKIEADADLIKLYGSNGASVTFNQLADEYEQWWSPGHPTWAVFRGHLLIHGCCPVNTSNRFVNLLPN